MDKKKSDIMEWTKNKPKITGWIFMSIKKGTIAPRCDETFKAGAVKRVPNKGAPQKMLPQSLVSA
ncbi:MAG: hypothetical protein PUB42_02940 [Firmicutes bacterium]|nr:hypothetical protein [Bacillota bacterium]